MLANTPFMECSTLFLSTIVKSARENQYLGNGRENSDEAIFVPGRVSVFP